MNTCPDRFCKASLSEHIGGIWCLEPLPAVAKASIYDLPIAEWAHTSDARDMGW